MTNFEPVGIRRNALRQLAEEARQRLAAMDAHAAERDFFLGVQMAAEDLCRSDHAPARSLDHESPAFKDGYLEVSAINAAASGHTPLRLPLPTPRG